MNRSRSRSRSRGHGGGGGGGQHRPQGGGGGNNYNRSIDSTGPDVKIRGNASHIYEKYLQLARDASASGDRVMSENYLQHAEHYYRVLQSMGPPPGQQQQPQTQQGQPQQGAQPQPQPNGNGNGQGGQQPQPYAGVPPTSDPSFGFGEQPSVPAAEEAEI